MFVNGNSFHGLIRSDGSFVLHNIPSGSYFLEFFHPDYQFSPVRLEVNENENGRVKANSAFTGARLTYPLTIAPSSPAQYFQLREPVNLWGLVKSPMVIMMLITAVIVLVFPSMMKNLDPKELEEMQKMQSKFTMQGMMKNLENQVEEVKKETSKK